MSWDINLLTDYILSILFGNYRFFNLYDFEDYFASKYNIGKKQVYWILFSSLTLVFLFMGIQIFILNDISLEGIMIEFVLVIVFLRLFNYTILRQFKDYCTNIETIGYFVVNELLVVLDTSCSLKKATKFISLSNYPVFSKIFEVAMVLTHFGDSLEVALKKQIMKTLHGDILTVFLQILEFWENGKNIALLSKNKILSRISCLITEETEKIDSWTSLSAGIIFLSPPVILCFLLISGNMSVFFGLLIIIGVVIGSFFINPERQLTLFSRNNKLSLSYDKKSLEFLIILSENLIKGNSFNKSLNNSLKIVIDSHKDYFPNESKKYALFRLGFSSQSQLKTNFLAELFPDRTLHLVSLIERFSMIDTVIAGKKLLIITEELNRTNELLDKGGSRLKAASFQINIVQVLSLISLAFVTGASPFFVFVSNMFNQSFTERSITLNNSVFELIYLITALVLSFLPVKRINIRRFNKREAIPWRGIFRISKFVLFLIAYMIIKNTVMKLYLL